MRIFHGEFAHDYGTYAFGYQVHGCLEEGEEAHRAYDQGFLPRSNERAITDRFYMARSVRVPLARYTPTSENRRILKKFDGTLEEAVLTREELSCDDAFKTLFLSYFEKKHGVGVMSKERLEGILRTPLSLRGIRYSAQGSPVAYALEIADNGFLHYWYPVYESERAGTSLGMWMMLDAVRRAGSEGREYAYLGTAYGEKGRYKMNLDPLEYWNGEEWKDDREALKALIATEATRVFAR
jgi:arginyl-tRNA--protein-N-Asp/Glu arginylyltransferase